MTAIERVRIILFLREVGRLLDLCDLSGCGRSGFYPRRGSAGDHDQEHDDGYDHQDFLDGITFDPADEFCEHRIFYAGLCNFVVQIIYFCKNKQ